MILSDIRSYMKTHKRASIDDLWARFECDKSALEGMMELLKTRGQIIELGCGDCGGSGGCSFAGPKIYAWAGSGASSNCQTSFG